jgi:hypothetical protein
MVGIIRCFMDSSVGTRPYPQTLDYAGKACQGQTLDYYKNPLITSIKSLIGLALGLLNEHLKVANLQNEIKKNQNKEASLADLKEKKFY